MKQIAPTTVGPRQSLCFVLCMILPLAAVAATETTLDSNGDGVITITELQASYPEVSAETFAWMDTDSNGVLDETEITAAIDAGALPTPENQS